MTDFHPSFVQKIHKKPYEAISPLLPALSQQHRCIIITGGSSEIGYAIARAFVEASASRIIILARRQEAVTAAVSSLLSELPSTFRGEIQGRVCDISNQRYIDELWDNLKRENVEVDVVVLNAASFSQTKPMLELGAETLLDDYHANVLSGYLFAQRLVSQKLGSKKYLVQVSTVAIYNFDTAPHNLNYGASKNAATLLMQLVARDMSPKELQIISFHPGAALTPAARDHGYDDNTLPWDDVNLPGNFAVWAASEEAEFLHGRFVWAAWDVTELKSGEARSLIDGDPSFLKIGVKGL